MAILAMFAAKGAARQGLEYLQNGDVAGALVAALSAQRAVTCSAGQLLGLQLGETLEAEKRALSKLSAKGARRRHEENRALKQDVFDWCDQNMKSYRTMDEAAFAVAEKVVPLKFGAVRKHMPEWKKARGV
jgi:hypothetical protein